MKIILIAEIQTLFYLLTSGVIGKAVFDANVDRINAELALVAYDTSGV